MENKSKTCPSAKFSKGALLIGIRNDEDQMDIIEEPIKITEELFEQFESTETKPEKTLRLANKCIESGCKQWTGEKCGVIDGVLERVEEQYLKDHLPKCGIRNDCRWFAQRGALACKVCPLVTTYTEEPKDDKFFRVE